MARSATAAAAAPPLLPTPPNSSLPALLPTPPSICRFAPSPASPAPRTRRVAPSPASPSPSASKKPGRASASESWVTDKAARAGLAPPSSMERTNGSKIPGRASFSESWVKDKLAGTAPADTPANSGCGKRSLTPSSSRNSSGKKQRYESPTPKEDSDSDSELDFYAGPAFLNAPPASALPMPWLVSRRLSSFWLSI